MHPPRPEQSVTVFGWPNRNNNNQLLQTANFQIMSAEDCKKSANQPFDPEMEFCTTNIDPSSNGKIGTCDGNLGSPVIQDRCHRILVGIVVGTQNPCNAQDLPTTIFANLAAYKPWIFSVAGTGGVCPCE